MRRREEVGAVPCGRPHDEEKGRRGDSLFVPLSLCLPVPKPPCPPRPLTGEREHEMS